MGKGECVIYYQLIASLNYKQRSVGVTVAPVRLAPLLTLYHFVIAEKPEGASRFSTILGFERYHSNLMYVLINTKHLGAQP